ncbi:MAG: carbohydrate kinase family protein [Microgenomates group bacterium]
MNHKSVVVIGDVTIDVFLTPKAGEASCQMKQNEKFLCFSYGDKIPVESVTYLTGGNAANVSIGLRRLDIPASIYTTIGTDSVSKMIYEHLELEQINTQHVTMKAGIASNYSTVIVYQGERTILTYHAPKTYTFTKEPCTDCYVYLTSMGENFMSFYRDLINQLKENPGVTLFFNPGSLQVRAPIEDIHFILSRTNTLFVNRQEAEIFSGLSDSETKEKELLQTLAHLGPQHIVITDGKQGVFAYNGSEYYRSSVIPVTVVEKTGAGDAFNSAFVAAILKDLSFEQALQWGTMNAASVIGYVGAQKGLLHTKDIDAWSRIYTDAKATIERF